MMRYFKKCEEFAICSEVGESNLLFPETFDERRTLYQIVVKGEGRVGRIFDSEYTKLDEKDNNFVDLKKYMGTDTIFQSYKPFHIYGFNKIDNYDWDGKLVTQSFRGDDKSWLICFYGEPIVNGVIMKTMDYAKLSDKEYEVILNGSLLGIFTKND